MTVILSARKYEGRVEVRNSIGLLMPESEIDRVARDTDFQNLRENYGFESQPSNFKWSEYFSNN